MRRFLMISFWIITAVIALMLTAQPVGHFSRINLSIIVIVALGVISLLKLDGIWRHIFLALASVIVIQYAYWRTTSTLPPIDDLYSFIPGFILYLAEMFCVVMLGISLFVLADPITRPPAPRLSDEAYPTVDVFVPTYNEDREILALTLSAAKAMIYPKDKLNIYLLDDGGTDAKRNSQDPDISAAANNRAVILKDLCAELGVTYRTRAENTHAKAGNLNSGLWGTTGEVVVVFDADHAPERHFLQETVGYFSEDDRLFLVQTPHFFSNPDPIERNLGTFGRMPSENEMFYGKIQKGLDRWNASFFCGSAAVLRRAALEEVGGFSGITITEDCETALELHSRGWNSLYVDKPMISGLQPETFSSFIGQRSRWCQGMVQILLLKNPLFKRGLSLPQKLCYLSSSMFWFFPLVRSVFLVAPLLFILLNMKIFVASTEDFVAYTIMYLIVGEMVRSYLFGSVRWPWISELYEYVQSVYLLRAIISVIMQPRRPTFKVTAKGELMTQDRMSELSLPYFLIYGVLGATLGVAAYRYNTSPEISGLLLIVGAWNLMNFTIAGCALGVVTERRQDINGLELPVRSSVELFFKDITVPGTMVRASTRGGHFIPAKSLPLSLRKGDYGRLVPLAPSTERIVNSMPIVLGAHNAADPSIIEITFDAEIFHYPVIAELMFNDMSVVRATRTKRQASKSFIFATIGFIRWSIICPFAALGVALSGHPTDLPVPRKSKNSSDIELATFSASATKGGVQ